MLLTSLTTENYALHLPPLTDMDTFVDILTLCNYCILSNVLDPRTYNFADLQYGYPASATHLLRRQQHDYNALSPDDCRYFSYVHGLAINLIHWINCHYVFEGNTTEDPLITARKYFHYQVRVIIHYKMNAEKDDVQGVPNCTESDLRRQISLLLADGMTEFAGLSLANLKDAGSLAWETGHTPAKRTKPLDFKGIRYSLYHMLVLMMTTERDPLVLGTTRGDKMFHAGSAQGFPLSKDNIADKPLEMEEEIDQDQDAGENDGDQEVAERENTTDSDEGDDNEEEHDDEGDNERMDADAEGDNERMDEDADGYKTGGDDDEGEDSNEGEDDGDGSPETSDMEYENWEEKGR